MPSAVARFDRSTDSVNDTVAPGAIAASGKPSTRSHAPPGPIEGARRIGCALAFLTWTICVGGVDPTGAMKCTSFEETSCGRAAFSRGAGGVSKTVSATAAQTVFSTLVPSFQAAQTEPS